MMERSRAASKRSAIVGSASVSAQFEHDAGIVEVQHSQARREHHGDALWGGSVGGLAAAALAEELGAVDGFVDGLAEP